MKVITRVNEYLNSDKEIFIESKKDGIFVKVEKDKNFFIEYGERIANAKVKETHETETLVTIYI